MRAGLALLFALLTAQAVLAGWVNLTSPYWLDEYFTAGVACQADVGAVVDSLRGDVHPPLFNLWVHGLFRLFGCDLLWLRLANATLVAGATIFFTLALRRRFGPAMAIGFLTVFAGSPVVWYYAFEGRSYAPQLAACLILTGAAMTGRWRLALAAATLGAALHFFAGYLFFLLAVLHLVFRGRPGLRGLSAFVAAGVIVAALYAWNVIAGFEAAGRGQWVPPTSLTDLFGTVPALLYGDNLQKLLVVAGLALLILRGGLRSGDLRGKALLFLGLFIAFVAALFLASLIRPVFMPRYLVFLLPLGVAGTVLLFAQAAVTEGGRRAGLALLVLLALADINTGLHFKGELRHDTWQAVARTADCAATPCGFFFDGSALPALSDRQYDLMVNFRNGGSPGTMGRWQALRPPELEPWLRDHPGVPLVYFPAHGAALDIVAVAARHGLGCRRPDTAQTAVLCAPPS